jgi:hypothetical protein
MEMIYFSQTSVEFDRPRRAYVSEGRTLRQNNLINFQLEIQVRLHRPKHNVTNLSTYKEVLLSYLRKFLRYFLCHVKFKKNVKLSLWLTNEAINHEGVWGSGYIHPRYLDLYTRWRWVISFTLRPLYRRGKTPGTHWIRGLVDSRAGMDDV